MREYDVEDFGAFLNEFQNETDRGAALVGAAHIDHRLADRLRAFMVSKKSASSLLDGGTAPLGTFSSRVDAAYALGLIDGHEQSECHLIRKVRNEFAHCKHGTTFADIKIASLCNRLRSGLPGDPKNFVGMHRMLFINAVVLISLRLTYRAAWVSKEKRVTRSWS